MEKNTRVVWFETSLRRKPAVWTSLGIRSAKRSYTQSSVRIPPLPPPPHPLAPPRAWASASSCLARSSASAAWRRCSWLHRENSGEWGLGWGGGGGGGGGGGPGVRRAVCFNNHPSLSWQPPPPVSPSPGLFWARRCLSTQQPLIPALGPASALRTVSVLGPPPGAPPPAPWPAPPAPRPPARRLAAQKGSVVSAVGGLPMAAASFREAQPIPQCLA